MLIYPAIDLRHGKVVRLRQGERGRETVYSSDPLETAQAFLTQGAQWLHVIDLDGAFAEQSTNRALLKKMAQTLTCRIQSGGGIRTLEDIAELLDVGVARVILGTMAVRRPELINIAVQKFGAHQLAIAIDAREGRVAVEGWENTSTLDALAFARQLQSLGVELVIHTDIARDGMLSGVNYGALKSLLEGTTLRVIASGGVRDMSDLHKLRALNQSRLDGVIVGRALYEGMIQLGDAVNWSHGLLD